MSLLLQTMPIPNEANKTRKCFRWDPHILHAAYTQTHTVLFTHIIRIALSGIWGHAQTQSQGCHRGARVAEIDVAR